MRKITKVLDGITSLDATVGQVVDIKDAKRVVLFCKRANHTAGSSVFSATVGVGTDRATYNKWISNATNTNAQDEARVASLTLSANGCDFLTMSPEDIFEFITVSVDNATDGTASAWIICDYED